MKTQAEHIEDAEFVAEEARKNIKGEDQIARALVQVDVLFARNEITYGTREVMLSVLVGSYESVTV